MYSVSSVVITKTKYPGLYEYCSDMTALGKNLANAALFRIRQNFTARNKDSLTANEQQVAAEIGLLTGAGYEAPKAVFTYNQLERLMRLTNNPDFFAGLPMQTLQQILKQTVSDFKAWLKALKEYKRDPSKFTGKPKMPGYKKALHATVTLTNQDCVLKDGLVKLPLTKLTLPMAHLGADAVLKEAKIIPYYGRFLLAMTLETSETPLLADMPNIAGVDFGTDNFAAIVSTDYCSRIYKGGAVLSENRLWAKERAHAVSIITKGHEHMRATSRHLQHISFKHARFNLDQCHKVSRSIIQYCIEHRCGVLVLGVNKLWKQHVEMTRANNRKFVQMPIGLLSNLISYKAATAGIIVVKQEESYTSQADVTAGGYIPVYGVDDQSASFSGKRIKRGLYRCHDGSVINADCNGAANILRKAFECAWDDCSDFSFLASPEVVGFRLLNNVRP